jgi:hypothetical protein
VLKYRYRDFLREKKGQLVAPVGALLNEAVLVATWRSVWIGWQTSYSCDMQRVIRPDASGRFTVPDVSGNVDVGALWFSRMLGTDAEFSFDLFAYVPGYVLSVAAVNDPRSAHQPWALAAVKSTRNGAKLLPITLQPVQSNPKQALAYYVSYLPGLDCKPTEITDVTAVRRQAGHEALAILCSEENPAAVDKFLASKILARPVGLIVPGSNATSDTIDLHAECESASRVHP